MKLLKNAAVAACLLASVTVHAQEKSSPTKSKSGSKVSKHADPFAELKKNNKDVKSVFWQDEKIVIEKQDGSKESFAMATPEDREKFEARFGSIPPPPPPAPPVPQTPPPPPTPAKS